MPSNQSEWEIDIFHAYLNRPQPYINGSIVGPNNATLSIRVNLDEGSDALTIGELKEMIFAKARELYPSS